MTSVQLKDLKGNAIGEVALDDDLFGIQPNVHVMHAALHRQLANGRAGTAATLTRSEVRGGGRKPWRQKGTGRARVGSIRSPLWNGGGVIFGPQPRDFSQSMPKKARRLALKSALAAKAGEFVIVKTFHGLEPKTRQMVQVLKDLGLAGKTVLLVLDCACPEAAGVERAARNLEKMKVLGVTNLNVKDLMEAEAVLMSESTLALVNERFKEHGKSSCAERSFSKKKAVCPKEESASKCADKPEKAAAKKEGLAAGGAESEKAKAPKKEAAPKVKKSQSKADQ